VLEYSESTVPEIGRRGGMTWIGDNSIEIGQPIVPGAGAAKFVERTGGGLHSVAVQVRDLESTITHLGTLGIPIAARPQEEFCFSDPRATGGVFFEWSCLEVAEDPRFGAPVPPLTREPLLAVTHQAWVGAVVDDPVGLAPLLAAALDTGVAFSRPDAGPGEPVTGVAVGGDCMLALYRLPGADGEALWGRPYQRARTHLLALRVEDLGAARAEIERAGIATVRSDEEGIVLDPGATGEVAVTIVEHFLPGDPRR